MGRFLSAALGNELFSLYLSDDTMMDDLKIYDAVYVRILASIILFVEHAISTYS